MISRSSDNHQAGISCRVYPFQILHCNGNGLPGHQAGRSSSIAHIKKKDWLRFISKCLDLNKDAASE